jgi:hypothetical protein
MAVVLPIFSQGILLGISNITIGDIKAGIFDIAGTAVNDGTITKIAVRVGNGPWETAYGLKNWNFKINSRQIVLKSSYTYDSGLGKLVWTYQRGPYYGDLNITVGAFNANGDKLAEKTVAIKIVPETPHTDLGSGNYDSPLNIVLKSAPEVATYYTIDGTDPKVSVTRYPYSGAIPIAQDTVIKAVAKSSNDLYSEVLLLDFKITSGASQPAYTIQYYQDEALTKALPDPPYLKAGTYFLKITTNKKLLTTPALSIAAQGNLNNVNQASTVPVGDCVYRYTRVISNDNAATGDTQETIQLTSTDINGNQLQNAAPLNAALKAAYVDTQPPASGSIALEEGGSSNNDPTPNLVIGSTGADQMRLALSETGLATAIWVDYAIRYDEFDISSGGNGLKTVWIEFRDRAGNIQSQHDSTNVNYNNSVLSFDVEYFSDSGLTHSLGESPCLNAGTYYLRIIANQDLYTNPTVNINAEGINNDVSNGSTAKITSRVFCYTRTIVNDVNAVGITKESITIAGEIPSNGDTHSAYTVTSQYILTITNNVNGSTTPSGAVTVNHGASTTIMATPNVGYHFVNWEKIGGSGDVVFGNISSANTTVTVTSGDATIRANFEISQYTLSVTNDGNGTTEPSGDIMVNHGVSTSITATPNTDCLFINWTKMDGTGTVEFGDANSANTTVTVTGGNATIRANFAIQYTLSIINNGNGNTTPSGAIMVFQGKSISITATPDEGYQFMNWTKTTGSGTVIFGDANSASTTVIISGGAATIQANFAKQLLFNTWTSGNITAGGSKWYCFPAAIGTKYAITWDDSYQGSQSYTCDVKTSAFYKNLTTMYFGNTDSGYTYPQVITAQQDYVYIQVQGYSSSSTGTFAVKVIPSPFTLTITSDVNGYTSPSYNLLVGDGTTVSITATPKAGYQFANWTKTAGTGTVVFGNANSANTTVIITGGSATIQANFIINTTILYTLTVVNDGNGSTTPSGATTVNNGESKAITAIPNAGYRFVNWTKNSGSGTVTFGDECSPNTTVTIIGGSATIQANFAEPLPMGSWTSGNIAVWVPKWYYFDSTVGAKYGIRKDDSSYGSGIYTCDIGVRVFRKDKSTEYLGDWVPTYTRPQIITAQEDCVYIRVIGMNSTTGSFAIKVNPQNTLTVTSGGNGATNPWNAVALDDGGSTTVNAEAGWGYQFVNWVKTAGTGTVVFGDANSASTTVTLTGGDATIQANFVAQYTLTVANNGGGSTTPSGNIYVRSGSSTMISATPNQGCQFINWTKTFGLGTAVFEDANSPVTTVTITGGDTTIHAIFAEPLSVNTWTEGSIAKGSRKWYVFPSSIGAKYAISWDDFFQGTRLYDGDVKVGAFQKDLTTAYFTEVNNGYNLPPTITALQDYVYILVQSYTLYDSGTFAVKVIPSPYLLNVTDDGHGKTNPPGYITVGNGVSNTITATPNSSYRFYNWTKTGGTGTVVFSDANSSSTTVTVTGGDATVRANFILDQTIQYALTIVDDGNGSTNPSGAITVNNGVSIAITATPKESGYPFRNWTKIAGTGTVSFGNTNSANTTVCITGGDATIRANFVEPVSFNTWTSGSFADSYSKWYGFPAVTGATYAISWDDYFQGSGLYSCNLKVGAFRKDFSTAYFTATDSGYLSPPIITAQQDYIYILVQGDFPAYFGSYAIKIIPTPYTLMITNDGNGSNTPSGTITVGDGVSTSITAVPNADCQFNHWTKTSGPGMAVFGDVNSANTTVTVTGGNATIQANFTPNQTVQYTLNITNNGGGSTTPSGIITVNNGISTTITATPDMGSQFINWTKVAGTGNVFFGDPTQTTTTVKVVSGNATIRANFVNASTGYLTLNGTAATLGNFIGKKVYTIVSAQPVNKPEADGYPVTSYSLRIDSTVAASSSYSPINTGETSIQQSGDAVESRPETNLDDFLRQHENELLAKKLKQLNKTSKDSFNLKGTVASAPVNPVVGTIWNDIYMLLSGNTINTTCRYVSNHAYFFVDNRDDLSAYLADYGTAFDGIYEVNASKFGTVNDVDNNGKVIIILSRELSGNLLGYFYGGDKFPKSMETGSNEGDIFYMTTAAAYQGDIIKGTLAHELQHMIYFDEHYNRGVSSTFAWLNEALSQAAEYYNGYVTNHNGWMRSFLNGSWSGLSLTHWTSSNYGYGALFIRYLIDQYGDAAIKNMCSTDKVGIQAVEAATGTDFNEIFNNFIRALVMSGTDDCTDPRYRFSSLNLQTVQPIGRGGLLFNGTYNAGNNFSSSTYAYSFNFVSWDGILGTMNMNMSYTDNNIVGTVFGLSR